MVNMIFDLKKTLTKKNLKHLGLFLFRLVIIGILIGTLLSVFQYLANWLFLILKDVFIEHNKTETIVFLCLIPFIIFASCFLTNKNENIRGGGVPRLLNNIRNQRKLNWRKDLPMMFLSSLLTFATYACLGAEGPSVTLGGNISLMVNEWFNEKDDDTVLIAAGAAFGCALQSPISGIIYIFEEMCKKINFINIIKALIIMVISYTVIHFIFPHQLVYFSLENYLELSDYYFAIPMLLLILIFNYSASNLFYKGIIILREFYKKHPNIFLTKYSNVIYLIITIILAFIYGKYMASGGFVFNNIDFTLSVSFILFLIILRIFSSALGLTSKVSGGIVIPLLAIGALIGILCVNLLEETIPMIDISLYADEIVLLSMLSFYVIIMGTPLTGISLIFAFASFSSALHILLPTVILLFASKYITKLNKHGTLYEIIDSYL